MTISDSMVCIFSQTDASLIHKAYPTTASTAGTIGCLQAGDRTDACSLAQLGTPGRTVKAKRGQSSGMPDRR
jgi:hypothetical protein